MARQAGAGRRISVMTPAHDRRLRILLVEDSEDDAELLIRELRRAGRRKIQEQLMISERMASVGTLAAGVAHEINNPLSVVIGNLDFVAADLTELTGLAAALPAETRGAVSGPLQRLTTLAAELR